MKNKFLVALDDLYENFPGISKSKQLERLLPQIEKLKMNGVSHRQIVDQLNSSGLDIKFSDFRKMIYRLRKRSKKNELSKPEQHVKMKQSSLETTKPSVISDDSLPNTNSIIESDEVIEQRIAGSKRMRLLNAEKSKKFAFDGSISKMIKFEKYKPQGN